MPDQPVYEVYAIKYAHLFRHSPENFIGGDEHDVPMPLDYFVWAVVSGDRAIVIDTGFDELSGPRRGRELLRPVGDALRTIGVDPTKVEDVIVTHMHYDHSGNHDLFPAARYHIQDREMSYCTGRLMGHSVLRHPFDEEDVVAIVQKLFRGRLVFHDGDDEIAPGLTVHRVGGHSMGLQMVRVRTRRGSLVLASDASHFYANMEQGRPFPVLYSVAETVEGFRRAYELASSRDHVIPGHDPLVLERYPAPCPELKGWVARLD